MSAWLLEQPSLLFYSTMVVLGLIGIFLIIAPALPIRKFFENHRKPDFRPQPTIHRGSNAQGAASYGLYQDYAPWGRFEDLALFQAACLWAGVEPKNPVPAGRASALLEVLKRAVWNGELEAKLPDLNRAIIETEKKMSPGLTNIKFVPDECYVSRSALAEYASSIGERPTFLFPHNRK